MGLVNIKIDGREIKAEKDRFILEVAREEGIEIPALCYDENLNIYGGCRLCVVEVKQRGRKKVQTACSTRISEGMEISTMTDNIIKKRRMVLRLLLDSHPNDCLTCQKAGECLLQKYAYEYDVKFREHDGARREDIIDDSSPYIFKDNSKCILCGKCVQTCSVLEERSILNFADRGYDTYIALDLGEDFAHSYCVSCNRCVSVCPVGALMDKRKMGKIRNWEGETKTVKCKVCDYGCNFNIHSKNGENIAVTAQKPAGGRPLCLKGRMMTELLYLDNPDTPYTKGMGEFKESDWLMVTGLKQAAKKIEKLSNTKEGE
ncbi:MAG: 2Fe-2S iron-sulfur cluster-binding protein [Tissierellia bacterium]|nr:2Fe-2S iron-sulfur cluster-binding protein [Tissierellia bacterium]